MSVADRIEALPAERLKFVLKTIADQVSGMPAPQPGIGDFTCLGCPHEPACESAWDLYNTDGDCLESK